MIARKLSKANETKRNEEKNAKRDTSQHEYNVSGTECARLVHSRSNRQASIQNQRERTKVGERA